MTDNPSASRPRRALKLLLSGFLVLLAAIVLLLVLALVAINTDWGRARLVAAANGALADSFKGSIHLTQVGSIGLGGVDGIEGRVLDPAGRTVIAAQGLDVRVGLLGIAWSLVDGSSDATDIAIDSVHADNLRVRLVDDGTGVPTLAHAFEPARPSPPSETESRTTVTVDQIRLHHVWAHGNLAGTTIDADLQGLTGGLEVNPDRVVIELDHTKLWARALPTGVAPRGSLSGRLELPLGAPDKKLMVRANYRGTAWGVRTDAQGSLEGRTLAATIEAPQIRRDELSRWLSLEPRGPLALEAQLSGTLDEPRLVVDLDGGGGQLKAELDLDRRARELVLDAKLKSVNLSRWDAALPPSHLTVSIRADAALSEAGGISGTYRIHVLDAWLQSTRLPETEMEGQLRITESRHYDVTGTGMIEEPGASTRLRYSVSGTGGAANVELHGSTSIDDPSRLTAFVPNSRVGGHLESDLEFDAASGQFDARVHGPLEYVHAPNLRMHNVDLDARATGTLKQPQLALSATLGSLAVQGRKYESVRIRAAGTPRRLTVHARAEGEAAPKLSFVAQLTPHVEVDDLELELGGEKSPVQVRAEQLRTSGKGLSARNVTLETEHGRARLSFEYDTQLESLDLTTEELDLGELLQSLHLQVEPLRGVATLEADLNRTPRGLRGVINGRIEELGYGPVDDASVRFCAALDQRLVTGEVEGSWKNSWLDVELTRVPYEALPAARLEALTGSTAVHGELALQDFEPVIAALNGPVGSVAGHVSLDLAWQQSRGEPARLDAALATDGLRLVGERESVADDATNVAARRAAPWSLTDADLNLDLSMDESTRELSLLATVKDEQGELAKTSTQVQLPAGSAIWDYRYWLTGWKSAEFESKLWILPRKFSEWPSWVRVPRVDGVVSLSLGLRGTYRSPEARWMASIRNFGAPDDDARHLTVMASGDYAPERGSLRLAARDQGQRVLDVDADWRGDALGYWLHDEGPRQLKVTGKLDQLPTSAFPLPGTQRVTGTVSGDFSIEGLSGPWQANLKLNGRDLNYAGLDIDRARLNGELARGRLNGELQVSGKGLGSVHATIDGDVPGLKVEGRQPLRAKVEARDFQLRALRPLVSSTVSGVEGALTADLSATPFETNPDLSGQIEVRDGKVQVPQLGQMFHDIQVDMRLERDRVRLEKLRAKGLTGEVHVTGDAELDGLALQSAQAQLKIDENEKLPLTVEGVSMGDAWGHASVRYRAVNEHRNRLNVDVDEFHLDLPQVTPRGVQSLDPAPRVDVGFFEDSGKFVQIPLQPIERQRDGAPTRWILHLKLGKVEVKKGPGVEIRLTGDLKARIGKKTRWSGSIDLTGGTLDVSGKEFTIESGSITFDRRQLEQGVVTARARWDSPLEYTVYAEYAGTVKDGELTLRSEPPLTEDEILGLILFGTPGGTFGAREQNEAATAVGLAGGTVTRGLNRALADISQLDVSTRVDTSTGEARPELVVQISPRATARVTQAIGEAPPGTSPDRTFLTVDLRLFRRWSVAAQVGDAGGSSLELIWRRRY